MPWLDDLVGLAHTNLQGDRELEALWGRGVTDEQIQDYQIGYLGSQLQTQEFGDDPFKRWVAFNRKKLEDIFVFPMTNALGQNKGVQFRRVERKAKGYLDYLPVKDEPVFFGLSQAMPHIWASKKICLVEGAFDLLPLQRIYPFSVPTMTSSVSTAFFRFLKRVVTEVLFCYDSDFAGRKGVVEFMDNFGDSFSKVFSLVLPNLKCLDGSFTKDPGDLWEQLGDIEFRRVVLNAQELSKDLKYGQRIYRRK